jgi:chemotaxis protein methyltransferase CheR
VTARTRLSTRGLATAVTMPAATPSPSERQRLRDVAAAVLGLQLDSQGECFIDEVLARRARTLGVAIDNYLAGLEAEPAQAEIAALARELTVGETYFFRNIEQFAVLRDWVSACRATRARPVRVLSAGCASGEEPYSIAMTMRDAIPDSVAAWSIRAVDANPAMIEKARRARYTRWALREMPPVMFQRWLRPDGAGVVVDDAIREAVTFEVRNLCAEDVDLWAPGAYDVVFCRNVLIHLTRAAAEALAARLARSLAPGGALFLGHAETMRGLVDGFETREARGTFWYERVEPSTAGGRARHGMRVDIVADPGWTMPASADPAPAPEMDRPAEAPLTDALARATELLRQERFDEALARVNALPEAAATAPGTLLLKGVLFAHRGDYGQASRIGTHLLAIDESDADAYHLLALCRDAQGDRRGALYCEWRAVAIDPDFALARMHLGRLARHAGDRDETRRQFTRATALLTGEADSRLALFGGGFGRAALLAMCRAELVACGEAA